MHPVRILHLADTHLGFDFPSRPRVERRRRGPEFFRNLDRALAPAFEGKVDLVVHGGDVFHRSRVRDEIVLMALDRVRRVTEECRIPFFIVPGNHERSAMPRGLLWRGPRTFVFDRPRTVRLDIRGRSVSVSGFPFCRDDLRRVFPQLIAESGWRDTDANIRLLTVHQSVEGATVGPVGYCFRRGPDVIPGRLIPPGFAAVLGGHIHRAQILRRDLGGRALPAPVIYPGSTARTAFAERDEEKGAFLVNVVPGGDGGRLAGAEFCPLPGRPMTVLEIDVDGLDRAGVERTLRAAVGSLPRDAIVRLNVTGTPAPGGRAALAAAALRSWIDPEMNVELSQPRTRSLRRGIGSPGEAAADGSG